MTVMAVVMAVASKLFGLNMAVMAVMIVKMTDYLLLLCIIVICYEIIDYFLFLKK